MAEIADIEPILKQAAAELPGLQTRQEVETWWKKYYLTLGHRRLGQLLVGRSVDSILRGRGRGRGEAE
ncbi:MAG: hypothetical protein HY689_14220 [Chloroflexi bacterium]|nr:hypothetical protein [Chloroflexota bacterium]